MRKLLQILFLFITFCSVAPLVAAPTPQDQFLYIYFLLQEADNLDKSGQKPAAFTRYQEVLRRLENLKKNNPDWEPVIVNFRIRYVKEKVAILQTIPEIKDSIAKSEPASVPPKIPSAPIPPAPTAPQNLTPPPTPVTQPVVKNVEPPKPPAEETTTLKTRISQLERELADTKNRLLTALEETNTLRIRLETTEKELAQAKSGTGSSEDKVTKLLQENTNLKEQLAQAESQIKSMRQGTSESSVPLLQAQLKKVQDLLALMEQENAAYKQTTSELKLQLENAQKRLADSESAIGSSNEASAARRENDILRNIINRQLQEQARRDAAKRLAMEELQNLRIKSDVLRQQIDLLGSPLVVLSSEELALLRAPSQVDVLTPNSEFKAPLENNVSDNPIVSIDPNQPLTPVPTTQQTTTETPDNFAANDFRNRAKVPEEMRALAQEASDFFARKEYEQAAERYRQITEKYPESLYAWSNLGVVRFQQQNYEQAEIALRQAIKLAPNDGFSHSVLGIVYYQLGKFDDAITMLTKATTLDPTDPKTRNYLGIACSQKGWQEAAEQECRKAIELDPNYGDAHFNLAVIYATQKPPSKEFSRRHYKQALELGVPKDPQLEKLLQ